ncbi:MAG: hypothetical protein V4857_28370 [Pseudomonadota bacterium]
METYIKLVQQLAVTAAQSLKYFIKGRLRVGFYWFAVRNYISLFENRNNSGKSSYQKGGYGLDRDCFAELPVLSDKLTEDLVGHFLSKAPGEHGATSFAAYCEHWRSTGLVRPKGVDISVNKALIAALDAETGLVDIVTEHLGLAPADLVFNAKIDTLINLSVERKLVDNWDDALEIHRDVDSFKFVKAFFYLDTVEEGFGHHEVYLGSHKNLPLSLKVIRRYTAHDLAENNIPVKLKKVVGKKGYGFIENTTAFHRGTIPSKGDRILLAICFNDKKSSLYGDQFRPLTELQG